MANLSTTDKQILEKLFQMSGGYVLNFSDRTMGEFFRDDLKTDIYNDKFNYASGSKASYVRGFWIASDDERVGKSILKLIEYIRTQIIIDNLNKNDFPQERLSAGEQIGRKLLGNETNLVEPHLSQSQSEKIVRKLKNGEFRVQSNHEGDDEHLFIFDRNDHSGTHVHLVVDGQTGEVRIDPKDKPPHDLLEKITTITTRSGVTIRSTKTTLEFLEEGVGPSNSKVDVKPVITFEIDENKPLTWAHQATGFNVVWGLGLTLKINNFKNNRPDYIRVKISGNTSDGIWESQHFIFQETRGKMDKPDEPFEIAAYKITEVGVVLSQDLPEHSPANSQRVSKPDFDTDTVVLTVFTESGIEQKIKISPRLISGA